MTAIYPESLEWADARQEKQRVGLVLREFGLGEWRAKVIDAHYGMTAERRLTMSAFNRVFPGFPICLESLPLFNLERHTQCNQTAMFRDFRKYVPYEQFLAIRERLQENACGRPVGILYRWRGIKNGLILHDGEFPTAGFKQTFSDGSNRVTVEHFQRYLRTLAAADISLQSLLSPPKSRSTPESPPNLRLWALARRAKSLPESRLLALLTEILFNMSPAASKKYIVRVDGGRWVSITEGELAERIGSRPRTVQRTVAALRDRNIIETQRDGYGRNQIRLCLEAFQ